MGYTDPRFINKAFVKPSPGGGAVPSSGGAEAFTAFAKVFDVAASQAREADIKADKKRAVTLGQNSVTVDDNGNVSRAVMPAAITTQAGRDLFEETQRSIAFTVRSNAIERKGSELAVKYRFNPDGIQLFTGDMVEYGKQFINDTDKDNAGRLALVFEDQLKKGVIGITQTIEEREWKEAVKQNNVALTRILSNIQEAEVQGLSTATYQEQLFDQLEIARRAGWIDLETQMAYVKESQISRYAGELFKRAMEAPLANLSKVRTKIHDELFKGGDKTAGFDIDADEIDAIMERVDRHINYVLHVKNLETQEVNKVYSDKMFKILMRASDQRNPLKPSELRTLLMAENITKKMISESPFLQKQIIVLNRIVSGNQDKLDILATRQQISKYHKKLIEATEETYKARWHEVEQAYLSGFFADYPDKYIMLLNGHMARVKAFLTEEGKRSDQYYEDKFSELANGGQLSARVLAILRATGKFGIDPDEKQDIKMQRWLQDNGSKVEGWIKEFWGDQAPIASARANKAAGGFQSTARDIKDASLLLDADEKAYLQDGRPSPWDQNTEAGVNAIMMRVIEDGVMNNRANDVLQRFAFSVDVLEGERGAILWRGLADNRTKEGGIIRQSVRAVTRARLIAISEFFGPGFSRGDTPEAIAKAQDQYTRHLNVMFGGEDFERIKKYVDQQDKDTFNKMFGFHMETTLDEESAQGITNFMPPVALWRLFFRPDAEKTNMRKFLKYDRHGETDLIAHDFDPPSVAVTDMLHRIYRVKRLQYNPGEHGDNQAMEDTAEAAMRNNLVGPTNWSPPRRVVDGEFVADTEDGIVYDGNVKLELYPIEGFFNEREQAHAVMEDRVRTLLEKLPKSVRDTFPDIIGNWFERKLGPIATLGIDKLQRWAGWTDLVGKRWIKMTPDLARTTRRVWRGEIVLQDPLNPKARSFVLDRHAVIQQSNFDELNANDYKESIKKQQNKKKPLTPAQINPTRLGNN